MSAKDVTLYHGSAYLETKQLKPGFMHTGVLQHWDETETNEHLYFTSDPREAKLQAIAGVLSRDFLLDHFQYDLNKRTLTAKVTPKPGEPKISSIFRHVYTIPLYVYVLNSRDIPGLIENHNPHNGMKTEYKTDQIVDLKKLGNKAIYNTVSFHEATKGLVIDFRYSDEK